MYVNIIIVKKRKSQIRKEKNRVYGLYYSKKHFKDGGIELYTQRFRSTIKTLIHEVHHQVLDELCNHKTCVAYDNIYKDLEKFIF